MKFLQTTTLFLLGYVACTSVSRKHEQGFSLKLNRVTQQQPMNIQDKQESSDQKNRRKSKKQLQQVHAEDINMEIQNYANVQYLADVCFGNPPTLHKAAFDTGSSNTWLLNPSQALQNSTSAEKTDQVAQVMFGSGALQGRFMVDEVRIGNGCENAQSGKKEDESKFITIKKQKIGVADKVKGFQKVQFDAIIGMAYPALAQQNVATVVDNIMQEKKLSKNLFSFYVVDDREEKLGGLQSEIAFGYFDQKKYQGEMKWHPVVFKYMYGMKLDDVLMNGKSLGFDCASKECLVTIDSGTSHLAFPEWAIDKSVGHVPLQTRGIECQNSETFGDLTFIINGISYSLPNNEWTFEPEQSKDKKQMCRGAIRVRDLKKDMFVLGDIFLRKYYTVFDRDNDRVGLAEKVTINFDKK